MFHRAVAHVLLVVLSLQGVFVWVPTARAIISDGANAIDVIGQYTDGTLCTTQSPSYTKGGVNNGPHKYGFSLPIGVAIDPVNHRLFTAEISNNRVLVFDLNVSNQLVDGTADYVLGQPDFGSSTAATTQAGMSSPVSVSFDAVGNRLFVSNSVINRVIVYDVASITNGENAVNVLGQATFTASAAATTQAGMFSPDYLAYDSTNNRLFVGQTGNHRVTVYDVASITDGENAVNVLGQTTFTGNSAATTQAGMSTPEGLAYDSANNRLFVGQAGNHRVTVYDVASITDGENAVNVLGQTTFTAGTSTTSQSRMNAPQGVAYDVTNSRLFVSQSGNHRVTVYDVASITDGENAVNVLGQATFTASAAATTQAGMSTPRGVAYDATNGRLIVMQQGNNRATTYDVASITDGESAIDVLGQYTSESLCSTQVRSYTKGGANNGPHKYGFNSLGGSVIDPVAHRLFSVDVLNNRVLVFNLNTSDQLVDRVPDQVLGQPDFSGNVAATTQAGMNSPISVSFDGVGNRLFVAQSGGNRVTVYDVASITDGENAVNVLGQTTFTAGAAATTQAGMNGAYGLAYDSVGGRLFVSQTSSHRVTVYDVASITDGENAVNVLGQMTFTASAAASTQAGINGPRFIAYAGTGNRLFVAQAGGSRVTVYDVASITNGENAVNVLGQANFTGAGPATTQAGMNIASGVAFDSANNRLFVAQTGGHRVTVYDVASITDGENAVNVLGQTTFTAGAAATTQAGMNSPQGVTYDSTNGRLYVNQGANRISVFDASLSAPLSTTDPTLNNVVTASRLKAGASSTYNLRFTLQNTITGTLTITFPAGFTVTGALTSGACTGGTVGTFGFTSSTLTAVKTGCTAGVLTVSGATVTNHSTPGSYYISWVNDDPGGSQVYIIDDDQVTVTANVDPTITMNVGAQAAATACDGTFAGNGGTVALGVLTSGAVTSSDASSISHICTRLSTNASSGAVMTVKSLNGVDGLKSTSVPTDKIPSPGGSSTISAGTAGYAICAGSAGGDSGNDAIAGSASPVRSSPFNGASCTSTGHNVGGLTTSAQNLWTLSSGAQNAFVRVYVKAAVSPVTAAHSDYTDTLTFIGTGTF